MKNCKECNKPVANALFLDRSGTCKQCRKAQRKQYGTTNVPTSTCAQCGAKGVNLSSVSDICQACSMINAAKATVSAPNPTPTCPYCGFPRTAPGNCTNCQQVGASLRTQIIAAQNTSGIYTPSIPSPSQTSVASGGKGIFSQKLIDAVQDGREKGDSLANLEAEILELLTTLPEKGWTDAGLACYIAAKVDNEYDPWFRHQLLQVLLPDLATSIQDWTEDRASNLKREWPEMFKFLENILGFEILDTP